jgi:hypothetical protein
MLGRHVGPNTGQHRHAVFQAFVQIARKVGELSKLVFFNSMNDVRAEHLKLQHQLRKQKNNPHGDGAQRQLKFDAEIFHKTKRQQVAAFDKC